MLISLGIALLLIFAAFKLGAAGITLYNLIRLLVGSLAYLAIFGILLYLFFFKWIRKQEGLLSGFFTIFAGLLLVFEAYLVWKYGLDKSVLKGTMAQVVTDLTGFRTTSFAGGGLIGVALYIPTAFLESDDFEHAIRLAVSLGGDSDTLAAITGSIAEACYGIPTSMREHALAILPRRIAETLLTFESQYQAV